MQNGEYSTRQRGEMLQHSGKNYTKQEMELLEYMQINKGFIWIQNRLKGLGIECGYTKD